MLLIEEDSASLRGGEAMIVKIVCPQCNSESGFSLADSSFEGPYRCWQCRGNFALKIVGTEVKSCEPISQEEFDRQQELLALKKKLEKK
jgi:transposase-like protein